MFELIQHQPSTDRIIEIDGIKLLQVAKVSDFSAKDLLSLDGVLVQPESNDSAVQVLNKVRRSTFKQSALIPVLISASAQGLQKVSFLFDDIFNSLNPTVAIERVKNIKSKLQEISTEAIQLDSNRANTLLLTQYLYSRSIELTPQLSRISNVGYAYPLMINLFGFQEGTKSIDFLSRLKTDGLLDSKSVDKVHLCNSCNGGYLNYRECCPSCGTSDLTISDLIHHFVCAHVAPEQDFKKENHLECPKCDKELRHIGIDYDKPSAMYSCNKCHHEFQSPQIKAVCIDCSTENALNHLIDRNVDSYVLTAKGEQLATEGYQSFEEPQAQQTGNTVSKEVYDLFKKQEIIRSQSGDQEVFEATLALSTELIFQLSTERQEVIQKEITSIMGKYLSNLDLICSPNPREYQLLLIQKDTEHVKELTDVIFNNISRLVNDGISSQQDLLSMNIKPLHHV